MMNVSLQAAPPVLTRTSPQAVQPGGPTQLVLHGSGLAAPTDVWSNLPAEITLSTEVKDNGKNASQVTYQINPQENIPVGIYAIRLATAEGVSKPLLLMVDDLASSPTTGKQTTKEAAVSTASGTAYDGVIAAQSRHYYKFTAQANQRLSLEVVARRLGSPLDPAVYVYDSRGRTIAFSDDTSGLSGDCQLSVSFPVAGEYFIEVRDIAYRGSANHRYRLRLGDFPLAHVAYPLTVQEGSTNVNLLGSHQIEQSSTTATFPNQQGGYANLKKETGVGSTFAPVLGTKLPVFLEAEPNNTPDQATVVKIDGGASLQGRLVEKRDRDLFLITGKKNQTFRFYSNSRQLGSAALIGLKLFTPEGKTAKEVLDTAGTPLQFDYKFPSEGEYRLEVRDLRRQHGEDFVYHVNITPYQPGFTLSAAASEINIPKGNTAAITVKAQRSGYNGPIEITAAPLPEGITVNKTVMGPGRNEVVLTLNATKEINLHSIDPVQIVGTAQSGSAQLSATANILSTLQTAYHQLSTPPILLDEALVLGHAPHKPYRLRMEPQEIVFGPNLKGSAKIIVDRDKDYNEAITVAVTPAKNGVPANIKPELKTIPKGKNEIGVTFSATEKAALGRYTVVLEGTLKKGKQTIKQVSPGVNLQLSPALLVTATPEIKEAKPSGKFTLKATLKRNPALTGEVLLTLKNLPKEISLAETKLPADQSEVTLELNISEKAAVGEIKNLILQASLKKEKLNFTAESKPFSLLIQK